MEKETIQVLPEWFDGEVYEDGTEVTNPYSGCSCWLSAKELSMYDLIKGTEFLLEGGTKSEYLVNTFYDGIRWFQDNNAEAYMLSLIHI